MLMVRPIFRRRDSPFSSLDDEEIQGRSMNRTVFTADAIKVIVVVVVVAVVVVVVVVFVVVVVVVVNNGNHNTVVIIIFNNKG